MPDPARKQGSTHKKDKTLYMKNTPNCLEPMPHEQVARVVGDLRMGLPCLLQNGQDRVVVVATERVEQPRFDALSARFGKPEIVITEQRALAIMTPAAATGLATSPVRICPPENASFAWFKELADTQFDRPNRPVGPLHLLRHGEDLMHRLAIALVKKAELIPAVIIFPVNADDSVTDLSCAPLNTAMALGSLSEMPQLLPVAAAGLPLEAHDTSKLHVFRDPDGRAEHYAIEIGTPDRSQPVLSRLHSACFTGDVLGSLKCDCGPQLHAALARMGEEGAGVLLYLNQEGRGIGLANKMRVYDLQSQGFDTVEANHRLGFQDDERDFRIGANILKSLGFDAVRLLTNNPAKADTFKANGIVITEQLPLRMANNVHNEHYLATKALKSGHLL